MKQNVSRTARVESRIAPESLALIRRAAEMQGRSVSDFMISVSHEAARRAVEEEYILRLSIDDQTLFVDALLAPPAPSDALRKAKKAHSRLITESR